MSRASYHKTGSGLDWPIKVSLELIERRTSVGGFSIFVVLAMIAPPPLTRREIRDDRSFSDLSTFSSKELVLSKTRIKMKKSALVILGGLVASCGAFVPADSYVTPTAARRVSPSTTTELNAFVDDMPGAIEPLGFFDPLGFSNTDENTLKRYRESELQHGRVAMLAFVGFLAGENAARTNSAIFGLQVHGPAINHFEQLPFWTFVSTGFVWAWLETVRGQ